MSSIRRSLSVLAFFSFLNAVFCFQLKGVTEKLPGKADAYYTASYTLVDELIDWIEGDATYDAPLPIQKTKVHYLPASLGEPAQFCAFETILPDFRKLVSLVKIRYPLTPEDAFTLPEQQNYLFRLNPF